MLTPFVLDKPQKVVLDVVRGLAAQIVVLDHALAYFKSDSSLHRIEFGPFGVTIFFILSGYLITGVLADALSRKRYIATEFIVARAVRIYTPYVPAIILVAFLDMYSRRSSAYTYNDSYNLVTAAANLLMMQGFVPLQFLQKIFPNAASLALGTFGSAGQLWTVCIEWWIYVTVGLLALLIVRGGSVRVYAVLLFASVTPVYFLVGGFGNSLTFTWCLGGLIALVSRVPWVANLVNTRSSSVTRILRISAGMAAILFVARVVAQHGRIYDPLASILLTIGLFSFLFAHHHSSRLALYLAKFADHSYSLYLVHNSILVFILCVIPSVQGWFAIALGIILSNAIAFPFALAFELPHRKLRDKVFSVIGYKKSRDQSGSQKDLKITT